MNVTFVRAVTTTLRSERLFRRLQTLQNCVAQSYGRFGTQAYHYFRQAERAAADDQWNQVANYIRLLTALYSQPEATHKLQAREQTLATLNSISAMLATVTSGNARTRTAASKQARLTVSLAVRVLPAALHPTNWPAPAAAAPGSVAERRRRA